MYMIDSMTKKSHKIKKDEHFTQPKELKNLLVALDLSSINLKILIKTKILIKFVIEYQYFVQFSLYCCIV